MTRRFLRTHRTAALERWRLGIVLLASVALTPACSQMDCAATASCAAPVSSGAQDGGGPEAQPTVHQEPTARGPHCEGMGLACAGDDCCASALVPGGTFRRSYDVAISSQIDGSADSRFVATVSDFRLDVYEVTIGRFRAFLAQYPSNLPIDGAGRNPNDPTDPGWDSNWNVRMPLSASSLTENLSCQRPYQWTASPGDAETKPVPCLTWYEAFAFCIWDGGRLPTEAEWNYAAAGGSEQRAYPWSSPPASTEIDETRAVFASKVKALAAVGAKPEGKGRWGHADLGGNAAEWVLDSWHEEYRIVPCDDCGEHLLSGVDARVVRGGSATYPAEGLRTARRQYAVPDVRANTTGVRCARNP